jgi:HEPN domain-containing protein
MNEEGARWRAQANADLDTARILLDSQRYGPCAFFCQQAAEKGLKAVLYDSGERPWGHSVSSLLDQVCVVLKIDPADAPQVEA